MKRLFVAALTALLTTGCAGPELQRMYYEAEKARAEARLESERARREQEARADAAMLDLARKDAGSVEAARSYFSMKGMAAAINGGSTRNNDNVGIAPPKDGALEWAKVLVHPTVTLFDRWYSNKTEQKRLEVQAEMQRNTVNSYRDISLGGFEAIRGTASDGFESIQSITESFLD